jgi:stage VI sporulation protein D
MNKRGKKGGMTMVEQNIGFRFDIYERIHLPEGTLAIRELEEIELTPYFQGIPGDEQTQLRGNLELTAVYESILEGAGKQTFIHRIPVEISLPVRTNVVSSQEIQVKIDQFDVELVSDRSLNVTGILSLAGWEQSRSEDLHNDSDEFYAEHQADKERVSEHQVVYEQAPEEEQEPVNMGMSEEPADQAEEWVQAEVITGDNKEVELQETEHEIIPKPDMKVAIKSQQHVEEALESAEEIPVKSDKTNNSLEWKRLFLIKEDKVEFKRLRMCIVQKEDTLESIANRYQLQPREIALYNRLGELDISEGQIIYIPKSNV